VTAGVAAALVATVAIALQRARQRYVVVTVHGNSMCPTYADGDRLLVRRAGITAVRPGSCAVFAEPPGGPPGTHWLVKRVTAVPGDPVPRGDIPALRDSDGSCVPAGQLVVLGDNVAHSYDSRHFGYVDAERLLGIVLRRFGGS
jgi:signal peptidase I